MLSKFPHAPGAFDPETTAILSAALDAAWDTVVKSGSPLASAERAEETRDLLARSIIADAEKGERDTQRLTDNALAHLARAR
ncbi:MAG: hypothetical protein ACRECV_08805 [Xanthobacteraceae bacterium]